MEVSVIISTYNSPRWLEKVLWGYECQTYTNFEVVIADDGSTQATADLIEAFAKRGKLTIQHIWQKDEGFQKSRILNKAIVATKADYLLFSDGDCIPRNDFLQTHVNRRKPGCFLSGGYFKLPMSTSETITANHILSQECFDKTWLYNNGLKPTYKTIKLTAKGWQEQFLNFITPTKATWNGHNASGWKKDIVAVNGHDERMQYGGQDREIGERLVNYGIKPIQIRYSAICLHLDHKRGYKTPETLEKNRAIRNATKKENKTYTPFGIEKEGKS